MNRTPIQIAALLALLAAGRTVAASAANSGLADAMDRGYGILATRNIFDGSRDTNRVVPPITPPKIDSFTLTGTMSSVEGRYAFFEGNLVSRRGAAFAPDARIAGFKIAGITGDGVRLESAGQPAIVLRVGSRLTRENGGPWAMFPSSPSGQTP